MQVAAPLMIAGSLIQGVGGLAAGRKTAAAEKANARAVLEEGNAQEQEVRRASREAMGQQIGAQAESGFMVGTGTALDSLKESAVNAEMDILNVRRKAAAEAAVHRQRAKQAKLQGWMSLVEGVTGAAGAAAGAYGGKKAIAEQYGTSGASGVVASRRLDYATPIGPSGWNRGP